MSLNMVSKAIILLGFIAGQPRSTVAASEPGQHLAVGMVALQADVKDALAENLGLTELSVQRPSLPLSAGQPTFSTALQLDGEAVILNLSRHDILTDDISVLLDVGGGELVAAPVPDVHTYRGVISGREGARVAATLRGQELHATLLVDNIWWVVEPAKGVTGLTVGDHVVYRSRSQVPQPGGCPMNHAEPRAPAAATRGPMGGGSRTARIAFDADVEFFEDRGSLDAVMIDIVDHMNAVGLIYEQQLGISYEIGTVIVRTAEPDPYTSTSPDCDQCPDHEGRGLIDEFADEWNANFAHIERDTAHLLTGKDMDGNNIGRAFWFARICNMNESYAYSALRLAGNFARRAKLVAHELGHLWDAAHCDGAPDCHIMCSTIGGCTGVDDQFGSASLASISAFEGVQTCLTDGPSCRRYAAMPGDFQDFGEVTSASFDCASQLYVAPGLYQAGIISLPAGSGPLRIYALQGPVIVTDN